MNGIFGNMNKRLDFCGSLLINLLLQYDFSIQEALVIMFNSRRLLINRPYSGIFVFE